MVSVLIDEILILNFCCFMSGFSRQPTKLTLEKLYEKVKVLTEEHPDSSSLIEIGRSGEDRPIFAVKIHKGSAQDSTVVVEFGIHARELASPASGIYFLEKLLKNSACNGLLERIIWYVIPVLNPDGYKYAVDTGKLWRKNRARIPSSSCIGVDLNRNFPVGWENRTDSYFYCQQTYCGQTPVSEAESIALKKFLDGLTQTEKVKAYLAVHTCAAGMFYPYGYKRERAKNHVELESVGHLMQSAIKKIAGVEYDVGPAFQLGLGGGGVDEWVYDTYQIPLVYTFELGGETYSSRTCFFPSPSLTKRLIRECFAGLEALVSYISPNALSGNVKIQCYNDTVEKTSTEQIQNQGEYLRNHASWPHVIWCLALTIFLGCITQFSNK